MNRHGCDVTLFVRTLERYRAEHADRLPFLIDSPPANVFELLDRLPSLEGEALTTALHFVGDLKDRRAAPALIELLESCDAAHAEPLAHVVATIGGRRACPALLRVLSRTDDPQRRWAALYALTWLMDQRAFPALLGLFQARDEPARLRAQATEALTYLLGDMPPGDVRWRAACEAFLIGLEDADVDVRFWCVYALGTMRARAALPKLRELAAHDQSTLPTSGSSIRDEAADAVRVIEG